MCGRYVLATGQALGDVLSARFGIPGADAGPPADRYNVAPTQPMPVIAASFPTHERREAQRRVEFMEWGFIAPWSKQPDDGPRPINARCETLVEKRMFRGSLAHHRIIVPASGFFEWQAAEDGKQPWYFTHPDGRLLGFAAIFGEVHTEDGSLRYGYAIITREAEGVVAGIHSRMPYILSDDAEEGWLDPDITRAEDAIGLLAPAPSSQLVAWPVDRAVGNPRVDDPRNIEPIQPAASTAAPQPAAPHHEQTTLEGLEP